MVATDTVVGVVGALVLIAVMVGVFAYEYNQADEGTDGNGGDDGRRERFLAQYGYLSPEEDIDGDGSVNLDDDDLDGDGVNNTDDSDVIVEVGMSGTLGPVGSPSLFLGFVVGTGNHGITAEATYTILTPPPLPPQPDLSATLTVGNTSAGGTTTVSGMDATSVAVIDTPVDPADGEFVLAANAGSVGTTEATLRVLIAYAPHDAPSGVSDASDADTSGASGNAGTSDGAAGAGFAPSADARALAVRRAA